MAFRLPSTITSLYPYNGHIPRIFLDVHVISLILRGCAPAQMGPATSGNPLRVDLPRRAPRGRSLIRRHGCALPSADSTKALATSARSSLRCLRCLVFAYPWLLGRRSAKTDILFTRPWPWLQYPRSLVLVVLRQLDRRWCPQHSRFGPLAGKTSMTDKPWILEEQGSASCL